MAKASSSFLDSEGLGVVFAVCYDECLECECGVDKNVRQGLLFVWCGRQMKYD